MYTETSIDKPVMQCSHAQLVYNSKCLLQCCQWNIAAQGSSLANAIVDDTSEVALLHGNDIFMGPKLKVCFYWWSENSENEP